MGKHGAWQSLWMRGLVFIVLQRVQISFEMGVNAFQQCLRFTL